MVNKNHIVEIKEEDDKITVRLRVNLVDENSFGKAAQYVQYRAADVEDFLKNSLDKKVEKCYKSTVVSNRLPSLCEGTFGFKLSTATTEKHAKKTKTTNSTKKSRSRKRKREGREDELQRLQCLESVPPQTSPTVQEEVANEEINSPDNGIDTA